MGSNPDAPEHPKGLSKKERAPSQGRRVVKVSSVFEVSLILGLLPIASHFGGLEGGALCGVCGGK